MNSTADCDAVLDALLELTAYVSRQDPVLASFAIERHQDGDFQVQLGQEGDEDLPFMIGPSLAAVLREAIVRAQHVHLREAPEIQTLDRAETRNALRALATCLDDLAEGAPDLAFLALSPLTGGPVWMSTIGVGPDSMEEIAAESIGQLVAELQQVRPERDAYSS